MDSSYAAKSRNNEKLIMAKKNISFSRSRCLSNAYWLELAAKSLPKMMWYNSLSLNDRSVQASAAAAALLGVYGIYSFTSYAGKVNAHSSACIF